MKKTLIPLLAALVFCGGHAAAQTGQDFVISDIRVEGLERVSEGSVFNALPVQVGDRLDAAGSARIIEQVFATGYFQDVQVSRDGEVLVLNVVERPSILGLSFDVERNSDEEKLKEITDAVELSPGRIFSQPTLERALQEMKAYYFSRGYYSVEIEAQTTPQSDNQVSLEFKVYEGEVARVEEITIIGNEFVKDKKLLKRLPFKSGGASRRARLYSREKLEAGIDSLQGYYQDRGFLKFEILSTQVSITPDKRDIYITISMSEGSRYIYTGSSVSGETIFTPGQLLSLVSMEEGEYVSRVKLSESREALTRMLADDGYVNATVTPNPVIDEENGTVSYNFVVDPGPRVYVRRILISGNTVTRDEVIRRELRQHEGGWYSASKVRRSRVRLQRLGFFERIEIDTEEVPGTNDQVDLIINVVEQSTGSLLFSIGYDDDDGVSFEVGVTQRNFAGSGNELSLQVRNSESTDSYGFSYRNPYATPHGISRTIYATRREVDTSENSSADYLQDSVELGVTYDIPLSEYSELRAGVEYEQVRLRSTTNTPVEFSNFIRAHPQGNNQYILNTGYAYDTRDSIRFPTEGLRHSVRLETALPGSDFEYYRSTFRSVAYYSLSERVVLRGVGEIGYGSGYGDLDDLPFYKNFYAGGANTVRGFDDRTLGPRTVITNDDDTTRLGTAIGGSFRVLAGTELFLPVPGAGEKQNQRFGVFVDAGQVYKDLDAFDSGEMRYSTGLAFYWFSPLGPVGIGYGVPLNKKPGDDTQSLYFTLGVSFR